MHRGRPLLPELTASRRRNSRARRPRKVGDAGVHPDLPSRGTIAPLPTAAAPGALSPPPRPPRFREGERLSSGLFAWTQVGEHRSCETWLAWSVDRMSHVAVKLPRADLMEHLPTARRLGQEARILRRLAHPAIQRLLEDAHWRPVPHLVLEHVEGPTLAQLLDDGGPLGPRDLLRTGAQIASCLHYLHGQELVHLDLQPASVVLRDGRAVLVDLGSARPAGGPPPPRRSVGSPAYTAPEQWRREPVDPRMDLYALGAVLYELATGVAPFNAEQAASSSPRLPRVRARRPAMPIGVERAIHALLQPDPAHRPATALDALRLMAGALPDAEAAVWPGVVHDTRNAVGY